MFCLFLFLFFLFVFFVVVFFLLSFFRQKNNEPADRIKSESPDMESDFIIIPPSVIKEDPAGRIRIELLKVTWRVLEALFYCQLPSKRKWMLKIQ